VILEALFLTRPAEADIAVSARGQRAIGEAIADAVQQFFGR
jgi:N-acetylmuramoyl-L-alanine amidase